MIFLTSSEFTQGQSYQFQTDENEKKDTIQMRAFKTAKTNNQECNEKDCVLDFQMQEKKIGRKKKRNLKKILNRSKPNGKLKYSPTIDNCT